MKKKSDLVCVFDIESGIYTGELGRMEIPESRLEKVLNRLLKMYDYEYLLLDGRKITLPRYVSVGLMPWEVYSKGCYENPEIAFQYEMERHDFLLTETGVNDFLLFWRFLLEHTVNEGSVLLLAHNANYDVNGIRFACKGEKSNRLIDLTRSYLQEYKGTYTAFPDSTNEDKTFDIKICKNHLRLVDTLNLSPSGCKSLAKWGNRASAMFGKDYHKGDEYNYDYEIKTLEDIPPSDEEIRYTDRDLQLCLFAGMMSVYNYRNQLEGRGERYRATDFPFSATQRDKAVNDGLTIQMTYPNEPKSVWKKKYRLTQKRFKEWCDKWGNAKDIETYSLFHNASTGGIITCNESYINKIVADVGSMDLGSSYPSCAGDFLFPVIDIEKGIAHKMTEKMFRPYFEQILIPMAMELRSGKMVIDSPCINHMYNMGLRVGFVCKLRFHKIRFHIFPKDSNGEKYWLPILPYKDFGENVNKEDWKTMRGKVLEHDELEYYCTHIGLLIILAFYDFDSVELLDGYSYEMKMINPIIHSRFKSGLIGKQSAKKIRKAWESGQMPDEEMIEKTGLTYLKGQSHDVMKSELQAWYNSSKIPVNAMYGANYRKLVRDQRVVMEDGTYGLTEGDYDPATAVAYPTGLYIAIYGQLKIAHAILWAISKRLPLLYVHTDSLKIQGLTQELVEEYNQLIKTPRWERDREPVSFQETFGIGKMEYEGSHDLAILVGNMRIVSWDEKGGYSITMSGLNEAKAFPREKIGNLTFPEFVARYLKDGKRYAVDTDTASGKMITDYSGAGLYIKGIGYSMQSLIDAEFILNNPESIRQTIIEAVYNELVGEYHSADYYAEKGLIIYGNEQKKG